MSNANWIKVSVSEVSFGIGINNCIIHKKWQLNWLAKEQSVIEPNSQCNEIYMLPEYYRLSPTVLHVLHLVNPSIVNLREHRPAIFIPILTEHYVLAYISCSAGFILLVSQCLRVSNEILNLLFLLAGRAYRHLGRAMSPVTVNHTEIYW
jgi:hypothetical protein